MPRTKPGEFSRRVCEQIGWYVYALRDPRTARVFYVGKGKRNRVFQHASAALTRPDEETDKLDLIRDILSHGREVETFVVRHGIKVESEAYEIEAAVIDAMRIAGHPITNVAAGHGHHDRGAALASVVASIYGAPKAPAIKVPAILIRIPRLWTPRMSAAELFDATRGWWRVGRHRERVRVAFAISSGVVREVYRIDHWRPRRKGDRDWRDDLGKKPRWGFEGNVAVEFARYLNTSVEHLFRPGQANPFAYVNLA